MRLPLRLTLVACALAVALSLLPEPAQAQTVTVDLHKASLAWDWTRGTVPPTTGDVERFDVRCGRQSGVYSVTTPINDPLARTARISQVLNGQGQWFCVIVAVNRYAPSLPSNEVSFDAGAPPAGPANLNVQAQ